MDNIGYVALTRQMALRRQMNVHANNIANMNTPGFKSEEMVFNEYVERQASDNGVSFVEDVGLIRNMNAGKLVATDGPLDFALQGEGWFSVGAPEEVRYTRSGRFSLGEGGALVTANGLPLLSEDGEPVTIPANQEIFVAKDGSISTSEGLITRIRPVAFDNPQSLTPIGSNQYRSDQDPIPSENSQVLQGFIESSNVAAVVEMSQMMETVRSFQTTQKFLETHHELTRSSVDKIINSRS